MLRAIRYPDKSKGGRGKTNCKVSVEFSAMRVSQARTVIDKCPQYIELVIDGSMRLDAAYKEAHRKDVADAVEAEQRATEKQRIGHRRAWRRHHGTHTSTSARRPPTQPQGAVSGTAIRPGTAFAPIFRQAPWEISEIMLSHAF